MEAKSKKLRIGLYVVTAIFSSLMTVAHASNWIALVFMLIAATYCALAWLVAIE